MNRCFQARFFTSCASAALGALLALSHLPAAAEPEFLPTAPPAARPFPAKALRAALVVTDTPNVLVDGHPERLSPGARIYGANNMLVLSASITGQNLLVNLVRDHQGLVHQVWILTEAEARQPQTLATPFPYSPR